jgi:hypothetical protein
MPAPRAVVQQPSTPPFSFIAGMYRLSKWHIPYFASTMTFRDAAANLRLVNDFPGIERLAWRLEELYQRDIDWPRVERQIVPYLRNEEQPQFFNALTVALLPIRNNEVLGSYDKLDWGAPGPVDPQLTPHSLDVGAISFSYFQQWVDPSEANAKLGQLRWNPDQVFSVAIDGQHRLAAIKSLVESGLGAAATQTEVPVILLVFDERLGFRGPSGGGELVDLLRRLFIDLNKHAVKVDRTRQILLDDIDPHSLCVRRLIEPKLTDGANSLTAANPRLPLTAVDWHTGEAKVDKGPYVTTILGLDWCVTKLLGAKPISDYMDYRDVERQLDAFRQSLGLELGAARAHLEELREYGIRPFSYKTENGNNEVEQIAAAFGKVWAPALVKIFSALRPYESLISLRSKQKTLTAEFVNWYYLYERKNKESLGGRAERDYTQMLNHLMVRAEAPVSEQSLKGKLSEIESEKLDSLAFNVVFQRALIEAFWHFQKLDSSPIESDPDSADELFDDDEPGAEATEAEAQASEDGTLDIEVRSNQVSTQAERFIDVLNKVVDADAGFLQHTFSFGAGAARRSFWLGALLSVEQHIDFTQSASARSAELILWAPLVAVDIEEDGIAKASSFDTFWTRLNDDERDFTPVQKSLQRSIQRYKKSTADRIIKPDDDYNDLKEDAYEERLQQEVKPRLKWVWRVVGGAD